MAIVEMIPRHNCCGCNACSEICPNKCIAMKTDNEGFWYPDIDMNMCVSCNLCEKVCPVVNIPKVSQDTPKAYAAYAMDEKIRMSSSSGGLFTIFAEEIIKMGGIVFGAAFKEDFTVQHIGIEAIEGLEKLRGSKYLQSENYGTYFEVEQLLKEDKPVLYTGTGCQIAGLMNYLRKQYDNLYTLDVLCHGVPSPKVWKKYLLWQERNVGSTTMQTSFRRKYYGWKKYAVELLFNNSTAYTKKFMEDPYMRLFLNEICLRPACHDCKFKSLSRCSDITLGDFWGIEKIVPDMDDNKGTSVMMIHSEKGNKLFNTVLSKISFKEVDANVALPVTLDSRKSVKAHPNREKFFSSLDNKSIDELIRLVEKPFFKKFINKVKRKLRNIVENRCKFAKK